MKSHKPKAWNLVTRTADEVDPEQLEVLAEELEEQVDSLTEEIENTKEVPLRKEIRKRRSALKKP